MQSTFSSIFSKIGLSGSALSGVGLKYVDRFIYDGNETEYNASGLINGLSAYVTKHSLHAGWQWHTHSGWFDQNIIPAFPPVLTQVNVDAFLMNQDNSQIHVTNIDMTHVMRGLTGEQTQSFDTAFREGATIPTLLEKLHLLNKRVLNEIITPEMSKLIKLTSEAL